MANEYAVLAELKAWVGITDSAQDANLAFALEAASRQIDVYCGRRFYLDGSATARTYTARTGGLVVVDDIGVAAPTVATAQAYSGSYSTTWTENQFSGYGFRVEPQSAITDGFPITHLTSLFNQWPQHTAAIEVTARWGWPAVPPVVIQATLTAAATLWQASGMLQATAGQPGIRSIQLAGSDTITYQATSTGAAGAAGNAAGLPPHVAAMLTGYRRPLVTT